MAIRRRGNLGSQRNPDIDPAVTFQLERLRRAIPAITYGDSFPPVADLGDMHYYTGEDTLSAKKDNWYNASDVGEWKPMSGVITDGSQIRGAIPSGVTVADYLSLLGGVMSGDIVFAQTQLIPASQLSGTMASGVVINGYLKTTGGQITGNLDMTNKQITRVQKITGLSNTSIDMSVDGIIDILATTINVTGIINWVGPVALTGDLAISGDLQVNGTDIGISTDTDLLKLALNLLTVNGGLTLTGDLLVDGTDIGITADPDLIKLAADLLTINGALTANGNLIFGSGAAGIDPRLTANGETNDGIIDWMEDEDYFKFLDDVAMSSGEFLIFDKAAGNGIKVDAASPTYTWMDLVGEPHIRVTGANDPTWDVYRAPMRQFNFSSGSEKEMWFEFHIPHDYVLGTDLYIHTHWSQIVVDTGGPAGVPGNVEFVFDIMYADGHGTPGGAADPFSAPFSISVVQQGTTTQYGHMIAEVAFTNAGGDATHLDRAAILPDGIVLVRVHRDSAHASDTLNQDPFVHFVDVHYQSTGIGTKQKAPDFYV